MRALACETMNLVTMALTLHNINSVAYPSWSWDGCWVRALFGQLINQFSRKWILADFIILWPTRKWKFKLTWRQKEKQNSKTRVPFAFFLKKTKKTNSVWFIRFSFFWRNKKVILYHAFLFCLSEENTKGIENNGFLFPFFFFPQKQNRKLDLPAPQGSLVPMLSLHTNGAWEWGYPNGKRGSGRSCHMDWR